MSAKDRQAYEQMAAPVCKVCKSETAVYPVGVPDMCKGCHEAAWARIEAAAALQPPQPGNTISNVWD